MAVDAPELLVAFGDAVRRLRLERGISQERLAELAGINRTYMGDVERGERNIALINIDRIARGLDLDLAALMAAVEAHRGRQTKGR